MDWHYGFSLINFHTNNVTLKDKENKGYFRCEFSSKGTDWVGHGPRYYLDTSALEIFGKSVPMRNFKKWH